MNQSPYRYQRSHATRYTFVSNGNRGSIIKLVEFSPTSIKNIFNLGFGDLRPDGSISDNINSNNDDIIKVLSTIIQIIQNFTAEYPYRKIIFTGSTEIRTALYYRILKTYYQSFKKNFIITGLVNSEKGFVEIPVNPESTENFLAFFVTRNN